MIVISADKIIRETAKAVLVRLQSGEQMQIDGTTQREVLELWLPKSKINKDYQRLETIHCPDWVYAGAVAFANKNAQ